MQLKNHIQSSKTTIYSHNEHFSNAFLLKYTFWKCKISKYLFIALFIGQQLYNNKQLEFIDFGAYSSVYS